MRARRILYGPPMRARVGSEGSHGRVILLTGQPLRFYLTVRALGIRVRLFGRHPFAWIGRD